MFKQKKDKEGRAKHDTSIPNECAFSVYHVRDPNGIEDPGLIGETQ